VGAATTAGQPTGPVIVVGAGPVGTTAALLLADAGICVIMLERHAEPHPLPRAVHLDDEVIRTLSRAGVGAEFLARSRPCSGLRLLDAGHRVMAELGRAASGVHGVPQANMFHQPDLEELLLSRVAAHPLITVHRTAEVVRLGDPAGATGSSPPVTVTARTGASGQEREFAGSVVLGCDGAGSTVRDLVGVTMEDLGFTERWLVIDIRVAGGLDTWDGVEQVCDPARAATFMQVTGDRYRWEFQLHAGEDESALLTPAALGGLLAPWTGRANLDGLEVIRNASYVFRARLAPRFRAGRVFLLGDAAHLTPPFIGQGLAAGLRDADNLTWKIEHVLTGRSGEDLLDSYDAERRPHARALVKKAVMIGWAMTGGQDRAAAVRRVTLAAAVRVAPVRDALAATATPRLKAGALRPGTGRVPVRPGPRVRPGSLIPNPLVRVPGAAPVRLDAILACRTTMLTARQPERALADLCDRFGIQLLRVRAGTAPDEPVRPGSPAAGQPACAPDRWIEVGLAGGEPSGPMQALVADPALAILVRPDRVIAAAAGRRRLPVVPWPIRPDAGTGPAASAHAIRPDPAGHTAADPGDLRVRRHLDTARPRLRPRDGGAADCRPGRASQGTGRRQDVWRLPWWRR
jgi:3-(3-hydroxy-phenyl)propionate hydroxylase